MSYHLAGLLLSLLPIGDLTHGPFLGHVGATEAHLWARVEKPGDYLLDWRGAGIGAAGAGGRCRVRVTEESDLCVTFPMTGLEADTEVTYVLRRDGDLEPLVGGRLRTAPGPDSVAPVQLVFGSCANDIVRPDQPIWARIAAEKPDVLVLLGDTPYIDSTDLVVQRRRYREFFSQAQMAKVLARVPTYATWDDHDFGRNDTDGRLEGKQNSRRAFLEYHANPSAGESGHGIYTSFRRGPVEVFLLDTRWFAGTEPSWADAERLTLLGQAQWAWLRRGLAASTAPFKVLACGMIWNEATRPFKTDHWGAYTHEREALFRWIGERKISGVVLVGGDIHRTRVVRHDVETLAGYPLVEWITSPLAYRVIKSANAPHPGLLFDAGVEDTCLLLEVETKGEEVILRGRIIDATGKTLFSLEQKTPR
jgi:alkaline phosphatase D